MTTQLSDWEELKNSRQVDEHQRLEVERDLNLGELVYSMRKADSLTQAELAKKMGTTQSVVSRLEEGGGSSSRMDTLIRVAKALDRHLVISFPKEIPPTLKDAVHIA